MTLWIVTIKLEMIGNKTWEKRFGKCPHSFEDCTDILGKHHSFIYNGGNSEGAEDIRAKFSNSYHVTRVEKA